MRRPCSGATQLAPRRARGAVVEVWLGAANRDAGDGSSNPPYVVTSHTESIQMRFDMFTEDTIGEHTCCPHADIAQLRSGERRNAAGVFWARSRQSSRCGQTMTKTRATDVDPSRARNRTCISSFRTATRYICASVCLPRSLTDALTYGPRDVSPGSLHARAPTPPSIFGSDPRFVALRARHDQTARISPQNHPPCSASGCHHCEYISTSV